MAISYILYSYILERGASLQLCLYQIAISLESLSAQLTLQSSGRGDALWMTKVEFYAYFVINNLWLDRNKLAFFL